MEQFLDIETHGTFLSVDRGFLVLAAKDKEPQRIPFDRLGAISISGRGGCVTKQVLLETANRGIPFFVCDDRFTPTGWWLPVTKGHRQAALFDKQAEALRPLKKRLWASLVQSKVRMQGTLLEKLGRGSNFDLLARRVRSGDIDNIEAQAAARYWKLLFGESFRRDREGDGLNIPLNYGYGVLRARVARAIVCAGLHPTLGIFHRNQSNPLRLVDDLMEPFRPFIDFVTFRAWEFELVDVRHSVRLGFIKSFNTRLPFDGLKSDLGTIINRAAISLADSFLHQENRLKLPSAEVLSGLIAEDEKYPLFEN